MNFLFAYLISLAGMYAWEQQVHMIYFIIMATWIFIMEYRIDDKNIKEKIYKGIALGQSSVFIFLLLQGYQKYEIITQFLIFIFFLVIVSIQLKGNKEKSNRKEKGNLFLLMISSFILPVSIFYLWMLVVPKENNHYFMIFYIISLLKMNDFIKTRIGQLYFYISQIAISLFIFRFIELKWFIMVSLLVILTVFQMKKLTIKTKI